MDPIIGHSEIISTFDRLVTTERLGHAYVLVGPTGVGKATVARWVAKRVLCERVTHTSSPPPAPPLGEGENWPCDQCEACAAVARGGHPDVSILRADGAAIGIDAVREWTTALSRTSLFAGWKVGIVEGAESLTEEAANACLKAIEEPTAKTLILLTATNRRAVLPTIASRCAMVACRRVPRAALEAALGERGAASNEARTIAETADGCPGAAMTLLENPEHRREAEELQQAARAAISGFWTERLRRIDALFRDRGSDRSAAAQSALRFIAAFRSFGHQQLRSTGSATPEFSRWMELLARAPDHLAANVNPRLLLETIVVTCPTEIPNDEFLISNQ